MQSSSSRAGRRAPKAFCADSFKSDGSSLRLFLKKSKIRVDIPDDGRIRARLELFAADYPQKSISLRASVKSGSLTVTALVGGKFFSESADATNVFSSLESALERIGAGMDALRREENSREISALAEQSAAPQALCLCRSREDESAVFSNHGRKPTAPMPDAITPPLMNDTQAAERLADAKEPFFIYRTRDGIFIIWRSEKGLSRAQIDPRL